MNELDAGHAHYWDIGFLFDSTHSFWLIKKETVINTWITLGVLTLFLCIGRYYVTKKSGLGKHTALSFTQFFIDLVEQTIPQFTFSHLVFTTTCFCFVLACNVISIIPGIEEPTTDINTTLALGLVSFIYIQMATIQKCGLLPYIKGYFTPFFVMLPLNIVGKLSTVISMAFRLYGNIYGGSMISALYFNVVERNVIFQLVGLMSGLNIIMVSFFGIFEGFLQAFIFCMLSLTYLSLSLQGEGH